MNSPQALPSRDLFFRLADRLQLEACVQAVAEGKSVVLHSASAGLLDHYGQILVQRLRQQLPDTPTEIFFPTHADALIERFNEVLLNVSVDAATQAASGEPPAKLWIVHDASALPEHELKLMARLLQHLPGARVSAVLMLQGAAPALRQLDPQGRRLLRWEIEPPTPEQTEQMVQEARQVGREFAALELVARVAPPAAKPPAVSPSAAPFAAAAMPAAESRRAAEPAAERADMAPAARKPRRVGAALALVLGLLAVSVGVAAWLNPEAVRQLGDQLQQQWSPAPKEVAGPVSPASEPLEAASAAASEPASAPAAAASAADAASEASASSAPAASASAESAKASPAASAPEPAAPAKATLVTELPDVAQKGLVWLRQLDKDSWVIEHARHASAQTARKQIGTGLLTQARIVPVYRAGSDTAEFVVITGPFRTSDRARQFASRNALPASAQIHARADLLAMTQAPGVTAPAGANRSRP